MNTYTVTLQYDVPDYAHITVAANSPEEAIQLALEASDQYEFRPCYDASGDTYACELAEGKKPVADGGKALPIPLRFGSPAIEKALLRREFPGLFDGKTDVNGGDLVEFLTRLCCEATPQMAKCDNCGGTFHTNELNEPKRLAERLDHPIGHPDCIEPAGECPKCGALAYLVETDASNATSATQPSSEVAAPLLPPYVPIPEEKREEFRRDVLTIALEGGIGYWCACDELARDNELNVIKFMAHPAEQDTEFEAAEVTVQTAELGIARILTKKVGVNDDVFKDVLLAHVESDACHLDAADADCIVQAGLFNEVIFG